MKKRCDDEFKVSVELRRPQKKVVMAKPNRLFVGEKEESESTTCSNVFSSSFLTF